MQVDRFGTDGKIQPLTKGGVVCTALSAAAGQIAVVANVDANASEVYAVEEGGALRQITTNGSRWFAPMRSTRPSRDLQHIRPIAGDLVRMDMEAVEPACPIGDPHRDQYVGSSRETEETRRRISCP